MDWFERLTGFREASYDETRAMLRVEGDRLRSLANDQSYGIGTLELVSLRELREKSACGLAGRIKVSIAEGDVREMHLRPEYAGALVQVASQFNLLEMTSPDITPEHGVTRYQHDRTQGPACAMAAGAATIYRNYLAPVGGGQGQTMDRQFDGLAGVGHALSTALNRPVTSLWQMRNGYALCTQDGLDAISAHLGKLDSEQLDELRGALCIGIHRDIDVTDVPEGARPQVSQAFCSALPVSYTQVERSHWKAFATLVLEAAYEATLCAAVHNARRGASNTVLLTSLGGGAFGNDQRWIHAAMRRALEKMSETALDVRVVSFSPPSLELRKAIQILDS